METTAERIIRENFSDATRYQAPLRARRGEKLIYFLHEYIWDLPQKPWLELGCSTGDTLALAAEKDLIAPGGHLGIDISQAMIERAKSNYPQLGEWIVADMEKLPFPDASIAGIISNSSLQWLANPVLATLPDRAFREMRRVLPRGAPLGIVVPGRSLSSVFLEAYLKVYQEEPAWHGDIPFLKDPFSDFEISDLLRLAQKNSFLPLFAETTYETFTYSNAEDYLEEMETTRGAFLVAPFQEAQSESAWEEISEEFLEAAQSGKYLYESLAIYMILRAI